MIPFRHFRFVSHIDEGTDRVLLLRIAEGEKAAFKELYDLYWNDLYSISLSFLKSPVWAQDVVQDIFLKIWERRTRLPEIDNFKSYLFIFVRNELVTAVQKKARSEIIKEKYSQLLPDDFLMPDQAFCLKELESLVKEAVALLPPQQRRVYLLTREKGLTHNEIAAETGLTRKTIANSITKTLNHIREYLQLYGAKLLIILTVFADK